MQDDRFDEPDDEAPEDLDPEQWTDEYAADRLFYYSQLVQALADLDEDGEVDEDDEGEVHDVLFIRDEIAAYLELHGERVLDRIVADAKYPVDLEVEDTKLERLFVDSDNVRKFIMEDYRHFREIAAPPDGHRWWWLDRRVAH